MKTIIIKVPRSIIVRHSPHPEIYGESFVLLENDMTTDVYTNDRGQLFTSTNDLKLIKYLKSIKRRDIKVYLKTDNVVLRTIEHEDRFKVFGWFLEGSQHKLSNYDELLHLTTIYISHSITKTSHLFVINVDNIDVGIIGYTVIKDDVVINIDLFGNKDKTHEIKIIISILINYLITNYTLIKFIIAINNYDSFIVEELKAYKIKVKEKLDIQIVIDNIN